jgi:hypothetical protein
MVTGGRRGEWEGKGALRETLQYNFEVRKIHKEKRKNFSHLPSCYKIFIFASVHLN